MVSALATAWPEGENERTVKTCPPAHQNHRKGGWGPSHGFQGKVSLRVQWRPCRRDDPGTAEVIGSASRLIREKPKTSASLRHSKASRDAVTRGKRLFQKILKNSPTAGFPDPAALTLKSG